MEDINQVEANAAQINGTASHEDNTPNGTHEEKKLVAPLEKSESEKSTETKTEASSTTVQKPKLSNVEITNLSKDLDKLSKYNLKDIVVQILKSFPETESPIKEQIKILTAPKTPRTNTPRKNSASTPRANNNNNTSSSPSRPSTSRSTPSSSNPNLFSAGPTAKRVTVFLAGQELKNGQVVLINQGKTWQSFVDDVTNKMKFINNNIKIYSYPAGNLIQSIEEVESGMQLLAALPNQKPVVTTAPASPRKTQQTQPSPAKSNTTSTSSPAKSNNAPPSVSVAPRKSDPGPISQRHNNNNAGSSTPRRVYQPKTPTKSESQPDTSKSVPTSSGEKKVMVRGPVQREVVTNTQKSISVKDLIGAASSAPKNSPPSKSAKDGWILPHKTQPAQTAPEQPANQNATPEAAPQPVESKPEPTQQPAPEAVQPEPVQPEPVQPEPVQQPTIVQTPVEPFSAPAEETRQPPAEIKAEPVVALVRAPVEPAKPEESAQPESPSKAETPRAAVPVTSPPPEPKSDTQIAKDLDSKLLEVMNRRRMEQQQKQSS